jgi:hypothetical protein
METGKHLLQQDATKERAKETKIVFIDMENFNVVDAEGSMKYNGKIIGSKPHIDDYCTCPSQFHRNNKTFQDEHGYAFQCKHLERARMVRYHGYPS